ncbi:hypothetical protein Val02_54460 [Virgisporangium aliadipatigenens]|uniref:Transglycosylase SLT domain-containing protein n=1 Tax=Virgisporangium aliadipatigenens TaxID=741659 RepID=A0A8J3YRH2_9ACTN|nr:lytic murein transglycosylase [Virgisporangium aliadipatigenens]GIJ48560.1 hypothetical protein Val02_54460 [Virgisporangium aliadipatigenens]
MSEASEAVGRDREQRTRLRPAVPAPRKPGDPGLPVTPDTPDAAASTASSAPAGVDATDAAVASGSTGPASTTTPATAGAGDAATGTSDGAADTGDSPAETAAADSAAADKSADAEGQPTGGKAPETAAESDGSTKAAAAEAGPAADSKTAEAKTAEAKTVDGKTAEAEKPADGKVDLVKRDSAAAAKDGASTKVDLVKVTRRPSPAHLRTDTTGAHRRPMRGAAGAIGRAARRGARGTRAWSRRPSGRMVLPGLFMLALVVAVAGGGLAVERTQGKPVAAPQASPSQSEEPAPDAGAEDPSAGLPSGGPDSDAGFVPARRPADSLATWASPMAVRTGVPVIALQAYGFAELVVTQESPTCHLRWTTLAGIGKIESDHGRGNGSSLANDGRVNPAIMGLPLDGQGNRRAIPDTDSGELDGDRTWDRAMGPMQFIPSTWARFAADGDFDGVTDPQDIDDAALAAGRYLCAGNRDLDTAEGWKAAILSYNNVQTYVDNVFTAANDYGAKSRV